MSVPTPPADQLSGQNPWPGLRAFTERDQNFFFGREEETAELFALLQRSPTLVLYGRSGLGKTSLLLAGLFPRLRQSSFLPVRLRLDHGPGAPPLARQITQALAAELDRAEVQAPRPGDGESLWEYFHRRDVDFWGPRNRLLVPVVVLDQFEEVFTLGQKDDAAAARVGAFAAELEALLEHLPPAAIRDRLEEHPEEALRYDLQRQSLKLVLSLREDFLPHLDTWRAQVPSLLPCRFRLERLSGAQAVKVVSSAGRELVDPAVARQIVDFVSASQQRSSGHRLEQREVEPALLSVVCDELNRRRLEKGQARLTSDLLSGESASIIQGFYERAFHGIDAGVRGWVEDELLTASGFRDRAALEDAIDLGLPAGDLDRLVDRRLLHREERDGIVWLELTHDLLTEPAVRSRNSGEQRRQAEAAAAREAEIRQQLRRTQLRAAVFAALALVSIGALILALIMRQRADDARAEALVQKHKAEDASSEALEQKREAEEARGEALEQRQRAEDARSQADKARSEAEGERDRAESAFNLAAEAADGVAFDALQKARHEMRLPTASLLSLVGVAHEPLALLVDRSPGSGERQLRLAQFLALSAEIFYDLGRSAEGMEYARRALQQSRAIARSEQNGESLRLRLAEATYVVGSGLLQQGRLSEAQRHFQESREAVAGFGEEKRDAAALRLQALAEIGLGEVEDRRFALAAAEKRFRAALALLRARRTEDAGGDLAFLEAQALRRLGLSKVVTVPGETLKHLEEAQRIVRDLRNRQPENLRWKRLEAQVSYGLGTALLNLDRLDGALDICKRAVEISGQLAAHDGLNRDWQLGLAQSYRCLGSAHFRRSEFVPAQEFLVRAAATAGSVAKLEPRWIDTYVVSALSELALAESKTKEAGKSKNESGLLDEAFERLRKTQGVLEAAGRLSREETQLKRYLGWMHNYSGLAYTERGEPERAHDQYQQSLSILRQMRADGGTNAIVQQDQLWVQWSVGSALFNEERYEDAAVAYSKVVELAAEQAKKNPTVFIEADLAGASINRGDALEKSGRSSEAAAEYERIPDILRRSLDRYPSAPLLFRHLSMAHQRLARSRLAAGDRAGAVDELRKSLAAVTEGLVRDPQHEGLLEMARFLKIEAQDLQSSFSQDETAGPDDRRLAGEIGELLKPLEELLAPKVAIAGWSMPPVFPGAWRDLDPGERRTEIERAAGTVLADDLVSDRVGRLRALSLSFYEDAILYEAQIRRGEKSPASLLYVRHPQGVTRINGTSPPIHEMNRQLDLVLDTREKAEDYLRFFCGSIAGDEGPFMIIESPGEVIWHENAARDLAAKDIKPLTMAPADDGDWLASGTMQYANALFYFTIQLSKSGTAEMTEDEPFMADLPILPMRYRDRGLRDVTPDDGFRLRDRAKTLFDDKRWKEAVGVMQDLVDWARGEKTELASDHATLAWYQLHVRDFAAALAACEAGRRVGAELSLTIEVQRAHALLFLGQAEEAERIYRAHVGKRIPERGETWEQGILEDFAVLEKQGLGRPELLRIRRALVEAAATETAAPSRAD